MRFREGSQRLRVQEQRRPPAHDRITRTALAARSGIAGQAQHAQDVQVVVLEGDREGEHVELVEVRADSKLDRRWPPALQVLPVHVVGQEGPLAEHVLVSVQ